MSHAPALVCFAVSAEARPFRRRLGGTRGLEVLVTGMGAASARHSLVTRLAAGPPPWVLSSGFAGGLDPAWPVGTVGWDADPAFPLGADLACLSARPARFHCSPRIAATAAEKTRLRAETGADAVEMESGILRALCRERGIPAATVRVISDAAAEDLPLDFNRYLRDDGTTDYVRLLAALARSPARWRAVLRFRRQIGQAAETLATQLIALLARAG